MELLLCPVMMISRPSSFVPCHKPLGLNWRSKTSVPATISRKFSAWRMCVMSSIKPNTEVASPTPVAEAVETTAKTTNPQAALIVLAVALVLPQETVEMITAVITAGITPVLILSVAYLAIKGISGGIVFKTPEVITIVEAAVEAVVVPQVAVVVVEEVTTPTAHEATANPPTTMAMATTVASLIM